jgi:acyl-CoA reductase-like NAD-dependent aldehyde dehydrogenase
LSYIYPLLIRCRKSIGTRGSLCTCRVGIAVEMSNLFSKVRSAAIDGRVHNVFYRKTQLKSLFNTLVRDAAVIEQAIAQDTGNREAEVKVEVCLAIQSVKDDYNSLNVTQNLEAEYSIAKGLSNQGNRAPVGIVVIKPSTHTFVYSVVSTISSSLAAGNCIILQVS